MLLPTPARILLIDDHRLFNDGLKLLLNEQPDLTVCGQVFRATDVVTAVNTLQPDLILLDVNLQGVNGIDLAKKISSAFQSIRIIMLTMYDQPKLLEETRKAGLHGYLLKDTTTPELLNAIRSVLQGKTSFDDAILTGRLSEDAFGDDFARRLNLTFREVEIIKLIIAGLTNEQIAEELGISVFTVKTHRKNIHFKLGITNVAELIQFAIKNGL
ncbi:response regulator [Spirosoma validum]|uniref:Response regulator transcription factor n=1 Tax=Spirosoma validum TaxID=2771355 RepID=A0A927GE19_9BACT|nr:response regulator transcription factor [Spirosoma validum]MBD2754166.1 response regulator transcription factor [Spirosoma validum]